MIHSLKIQITNVDDWVTDLGWKIDLILSMMNSKAMMQNNEDSMMDSEPWFEKNDNLNMSFETSGFNKPS